MYLKIVVFCRTGVPRLFTGPRVPLPSCLVWVHRARATWCSAALKYARCICSLIQLPTLSRAPAVRAGRKKNNKKTEHCSCESQGNLQFIGGRNCCWQWIIPSLALFSLEDLLLLKSTTKKRLQPLLKVGQLMAPIVPARLGDETIQARHWRILMSGSPFETKQNAYQQF